MAEHSGYWWRFGCVEAACDWTEDCLDGTAASQSELGQRGRCPSRNRVESSRAVSAVLRWGENGKDEGLGVMEILGT